MTALMMTAWFNWYSPSLAPENARTINIAVCVCYAVVSIFLYRTYNAYKIGMYRTGETFYAQTLANLFGNGITYVFACLIQVRFINALPVLLVFIIQTLISGVWCMLASKLYFSLHDPMKTLVIYKDEEDYAYEIVEECYDLPEFAKTYFDYSAFARDLFMTDYWMDNGFVFRCA